VESDPRAEEAKKRILQAQYRRAVSGDRMRLTRSDSIRQFGGDNEARIAAIRAAQAADSAAQGAIAPVQREMGGKSIKAARSDLNTQMKSLAERQRVEAMRRYGAGDAVAGDEAASEYGRLGRAADEKFGPLAEPELQNRIDATEESRKRQLAMKRANLGMAEEGRARYEAGQAATREAGDLQRNIALTGLRTVASEGERELATSRAMSDPAAIQDRIRADTLRQKIEAERAMGELGQVKAEAAGTNVAAKAAVREAALSDPGFARTLGRMQESLNALAGGYLGSDRGGDVDVLSRDLDFIKNYIDSVPPEQQGIVKQEVLAALNQAGLSRNLGLLDLGAAIVDPIPFARLENTKRYRSKVNDIRKYLNE